MTRRERTVIAAIAILVLAAIWLVTVAAQKMP